MQRLATETPVTIPLEGSRGALHGDLVVPGSAGGVVVFAHGSGSSRRSPRNRHVASLLNDGGLGTLLFDLLTEDEEAVDMRTGHLRFDIDLLASRLVRVLEWMAQAPEARELSVGCFGASTGAAAALVAAALRPDLVDAVVSRGGRPDLAGRVLPTVVAPTLLIVGGRDYEVIALNEDALARLRCQKRLEVVPGATHLFEEPGTLDTVAQLALAWFHRYVRRKPAETTAVSDPDPD